MDSEPLMRDSAHCKDYLIEALKFHLLKSSDHLPSTSSAQDADSSPLTFSSRAKPRSYIMRIISFLF